jgi:predicted metal-binding protein
MTKPMRAIPQPATSLIAICAKCGKKLGGGFGAQGGQPLAKALRQALNLPKPKRARVRLVETRCLKLCPKGAVAVVDSRDPGSILVIPADTPVLAVAARLGLA